uniref:Zf-C2H2_12 domain-containing protein n=1 Tax=Toxocara canis TaxID=6265 RepID=A0A183U6H8_TOXCA
LVCTVCETNHVMSGFNENIRHTAHKDHVTIHYVKKNEAAIRSTVLKSFYDRARKATTVRNKNIARIECGLALWVIDFKEKNIPLDGNISREKAQIFYPQFATGYDAEDAAELQPVTSTAPESEDFQSSKGRSGRL